MANRLPLSGAQWWDATNRNAYAGAKMYTYAEASRTTDKVTYDAADEATQLSNPIIADSNGIFPEIYGNGAFFIDVYNSDDSVLVYQEDNLFPTQPVSSDGSSSVVVDIIADLQDVNTSQFKYATVQGTSAINDGGQADYYYDAASSATPNGTTIVQPNTGGGRWLILNVETLALGSQSVTRPKLAPSAVDYGSEWQIGLTVTNTTPDYVYATAAGSIMDSTNTYRINLPSAMTKNAGATWAAGSGNGSYSNAEAARAANTWYTSYLVSKSSDPNDTDIVTATSQANALADTAVTAAGYDIARPYFGGLRANGTPNQWRTLTHFQNGIYKWSGGFANDSAALTGIDEEGIVEIFAPKNHNAIVALNYVNATANSAPCFTGEETIGYITPSTTETFDASPNSTTATFMFINKVINSGDNQRAFVSVDKGGNTFSFTTRSNTQGFYHNLLALT